MQRARLQRLIDAYGADPARWPAAERDAAKRLLAETPAMSARLEDAARLDRALDDFNPAVPKAAQARLRQGWANLPPQETAAVAIAGAGLPMLARMLPRAVMLAAASVAGIVIGHSGIDGPATAIARIDVVTLISEPESILLMEE